MQCPAAAWLDRGARNSCALLAPARPGPRRRAQAEARRPPGRATSWGSPQRGGRARGRPHRRRARRGRRRSARPTRARRRRAPVRPAARAARRWPPGPPPRGRRLRAPALYASREAPGAAWQARRMCCTGNKAAEGRRRGGPLEPSSWHTHRSANRSLILALSAQCSKEQGGGRRL